MRPRDFSAVVLLCALFAVLLMTQTVRAQTHPLWLQGDPSDTDPDLERLNRAFIRLAEKVRQAVVQVRVEPTKARGSGFIIDPFGLESSLHVGIVSRRGRSQNSSAAFDHIQVDSPANSGESGGPLVNMKGHVVGMLTQASENRTIGFAVPINVIKALIPRLLTGEKIVWGWLGVKLSELTLELADGLGISPVRGVLVSSVEADQPADRAGVLSRDIILAVDDIAVDRVGEVLRVIKGTEVGNEVTLTIFRSGETFVVPVKLGNKPGALDDNEG